MTNLKVVYFSHVQQPVAWGTLRLVFPQCTYYCDTSGSPGAYWELFSYYWDKTTVNADADLLTVEGDIVVHAGVREMLTCGHDWCEFPHPNRSDPRTVTWKGLGCDKFSAAARRAVPSEAILAQARSDNAPDSSWYGVYQGLVWNAIDGPVYRALEAAGFECQRHDPPVGHLNCCF